MEMTDKQLRFVEEYLIDLNAKQAAIRAGYSPKSAEKIGPQLLEKTRVHELIDREMAKRSRRTGISQDRVLLELARIGFCDASDVIDLNSGNIREDITKEDSKCIQKIKTRTMTTPNGSTIVEQEVTMCDKEKALELIGKHLGMFKDKVEVSGIDKEKNKLDDLISQMRGDSDE